MWKKIAKAFAFPPMIISVILLPISVFVLSYSLINFSERSVLAIISYCVSFYTLVVWCVKLPKIVRFFKEFSKTNKAVLTWKNSPRLRVNFSLLSAFAWNLAYGIFQLGLAIYHRSSWFYSLAGYYILLGVTRLFLARHTTRYKHNERLKEELLRYRSCGVFFLLLNIAISVMMFYMIFRNKNFHHSEITTIAIATYTFFTFTKAIVNVVRYRKYQSPVFSATKAISLGGACVSMLTLENTMLATFGKETMTDFTRKIFLTLSGVAVSIFIITMSNYMIVNSTKKLKNLKESGING